jgi:hypothetical protein
MIRKNLSLKRRILEILFKAHSSQGTPVPPLQQRINTSLSAALSARLKEINDKIVKAPEAKVVILLDPLCSVM